MKHQRKGLMLVLHRPFESAITRCGSVATGKLTHDDYTKITPMIDSALSTIKDVRIDVLVDGTELDGWEARAAWDDFKLDMKHGSEIALYGNKKWEQLAATVGSWFISR